MEERERTLKNIVRPADTVFKAKLNTYYLILIAPF